MIMGGVYLAYSAYFLSVDFITIYFIMNFTMVGLYSMLAYTYAKNSWTQKKVCDQYLNNMMDEQENIMRDSLEIKSNMLK
jgi:hypothetical protein